MKWFINVAITYLIILWYIYRYVGDVMVINAKNGIGRQSSNSK